MSDKFGGYSDTAAGPARSVRAVAPSDVADLPDGIPKALLVGGAGAISIIAADDTAAVTIIVQAGVLSVRVKRVRLTGTTATSIVALY